MFAKPIGVDRQSRFGRYVFGFLLFMFAVLAFAEVSIPALKARVTDLTQTLTVSQKNELEALLANFEARKGSQIAVLMIQSTEGESIEEYALRIVESWKLGRRSIDDGVLLLIAKEDRAMRIEVGYGLEGALSDIVSKRIIAEAITPYFKQGNFFGGLDAGVRQMMSVIDGELLPASQTQKSTKSSKLPSSIELAIVLSVVLSSIATAILGRFWGGVVTGIAVFFILFLVSNIVLALIMSFLAFLFTFFGGVRSLGGLGRGGFGGGGGGFGGGGGGFGGGGASGRW